MSPLFPKSPNAPASGISQLLTGSCILAAAMASLQYKHLIVPRLSSPWEASGDGVILLASITQMLFHGVQNLMLLSGWHLVARGISRRVPKIEDLIIILIPPIGLAASFYLLPLAAPNLLPTFPIHVPILFLLMVLFQLLTLRVGDGLDRYAALLLWVLSFQSLELFANTSGLWDRQLTRSEERRVGKECRSRWSPYH